MSGAFRDRVRAALAAARDGPIASRFVAPLVTAIVADAAEGAELGDALVELIEALVRAGVPRGRQFVLLGDGSPVPGTFLARARALHAAVGVPVLAHDPAQAGFRAGLLADGSPIELDDELREAEAIVAVGRWSRHAGGVRGGPLLLCPGVATQRTRAAFAAARAGGGQAAALAFSLAAEWHCPVDLALVWHDDGRVDAASGRAAFACLARAVGHAGVEGRA